MTANKRLKADLASIASLPGELALPDGRTVDVTPPELGDFLEIVRLAENLDESTSAGDVIDAFEHLKAELIKLIPELADFKLNTSQLKVVVGMLNDLTMPEDLEELQKQNIKPMDHQKKVRSASSKK